MYTLVRRSYLAPSDQPAPSLTSILSDAQLDTCLARIDVPVYVQRVVAGLADADEIKGAFWRLSLGSLQLLIRSPAPDPVICFLSLARLSQVAPAPVTQILDDVADSFKETMKQFVGTKDTVKQEFDRKVRPLRAMCRFHRSLRLTES
jgi:cullin-associated NEDD8-dissociated protein 1